MEVSRKISIAKTLTWRFVATTTTFLLAWMFTGEIETGLKIGGTEAVAKMFLYYGHERAWVGGIGYVKSIRGGTA